MRMYLWLNINKLSMRYWSYKSTYFVSLQFSSFCISLYPIIVSNCFCCLSSENEVTNLSCNLYQNYFCVLLPHVYIRFQYSAYSFVIRDYYVQLTAQNHSAISDISLCENRRELQSITKLL